MFTIARIPQPVKTWIEPFRNHFTAPGFRHFWQLLLAWTIGYAYGLDALVRLVRQTTHRTKHGEFLLQSPWDPPAVVQEGALRLLRRLYRKNGGPCFFILDATQVLKRGKKMEAVARLYHYLTRSYGYGHTILKACLWYRGVTIPWGSWLYVRKQDAGRLKVPFRRLIDLTAQAIATAELPGNLPITVLFDSSLLCREVVQACRQRHWRYIGACQSTRKLVIGRRSFRIATYGRNVLRRGEWKRLESLSRRRWYRLGQRIGRFRQLGEVRVVFCRQKGDHRVVALVTDDRSSGMGQIVTDYLKRWAIEQLIKEQKQQLGLGDYHVRHQRAIVSHLHMVDCAYACLIHLALRRAGAQGHQSKRKQVLHLPSISQLKAQMREQIWQDALEDVIRHSHEKPVLRRLEKLRAA